MDRYCYPLADKAGLLPDPSSTPLLDWVDVKRRVSVPVVLDCVDVALVDRLLGIRDKRLFSELSEQIWPPRTKTDLALRRTRLLDWVMVYRSTDRLSDLRLVLKETRVGWDLIFVTNIVVGAYIFGLEWWSRFRWLGALSGDLGHFVDVAKQVHNMAKTTGIRDPNWTYYVEASGLSGYRNLPYDGFDVFAEATKLADGGDEHNYFGNSWDALCAEFLPMPHKPVKFTPFRDWVKEGSWLTSGASSLGRVEFTVDGEPETVKARKNVVLDVVDVEKLAEDAANSVQQINTTVVKSELSKLRLAVSGDLYTYLQMTWVKQLLGGAYYAWPGNTSEENFIQQTTRLNRMLVLCSRKLGLPYDYASFDHQPTTSELLSIARLLGAHARKNVPADHLPEFDSIMSNILTGWKTAVLKTTLDGETIYQDVSGGLCSGLGWTAIVGNAWNSVMTGLCLKVLESWGIPTCDIERFIRGDDSAIFVDNWPIGAAVNAGYDAIGAKAGAGKFSLQCGKMEFLRVWFDTRCRGYACRSIPGLTQRKPWSSNPWSEDMVMRALYDGFNTTKRRLNGCYAHVTKAWEVVKRIWCRNHNLPVAVCSTPVWNGGLGIEPLPIGMLQKVVPPVPKFDAGSSIVITNVNSWRRQRLIEYASREYNLDVSPLADTIVQRELVSTLTSDTVPAFARAARNRWLFDVRSANCKVESVRLDLVPPSAPLPLSEYRGDNIVVLMSHLRSLAPMFGRCPELLTAKADYDRFEVRVSFREWIRQHFPKASSYLSMFHKSWHMSDSIDYLVGKLTYAPTIIHPALTSVVVWSAASLLNPKRSVVRGVSMSICNIMENIVAQSSLSRQLYWW